jgi:F-type H+-transporting ATPase subunit gamma
MPAVLSIRVIRRKIRSIGNIKKITRAMQMVAASKLKKVQERLMAIRPYADQIAKMMEHLTERAPDLDDAFLRPREAVRRVGAVVITADKGLCGSYNANLLRFAQRALAAKPASPRLTLIGRKAIDAYRRAGAAPAESYAQVPIDVPFAEIRAMVKPIVEAYRTGAVDEVYLLFTRYVNAVTFQPGEVRFLPIAPAATGTAGGAHGTGAGVEYLFEPPPAAILTRLIPRYLEVTFHRYLLESMSSEYAARMNAMRNATDNASEMIDSLTLTYNKARQAGITKELLDIVGGAEALRG